MTPIDPKPEATPVSDVSAPPEPQTPANARSVAAKARCRTPEGKAQNARRAAAGQTPEAKAKRAATIARKKALLQTGTIEDKLNEFVPGTVPGQQEFYHVEDDGTVVRWWIVPNTFGPTNYSLADDHPLGNSPLPGWYDSDGKAVSGNPRSVVL
jgi:hypothetical protein